MDSVAKNREQKKIPISDKLASDSVGVKALEDLHENLGKFPHLTKRDRYLEVVNLLKILQKDGRIWRRVDGSLVE